MARESIIGHFSSYYDLAGDVRYKRSHVPIRQLVTPNDPQISELANILHQIPEYFVDNCWEFVHLFTSYAREEGDYWRTPAESLRDAKNLDCDDTAILLCSLLRNYVPPEKVFCAVVEWTLNRRKDGHMCVFIQDDTGADRILESTASPESPLRGVYEVYALFNDKYALATKAGLQLFDLRPVAAADTTEEVSFATQKG